MLFAVNCSWPAPARQILLKGAYVGQQPAAEEWWWPGVHVCSSRTDFSNDLLISCTGAKSLNLSSTDTALTWLNHRGPPKLIIVVHAT